ncbi:hypothetical protein A2801_02655 [Candidatus Woesebacteria bacterium RIFCSPHIGHO2_01_FULL_41_10]|uniref:ATP-dependent Clp protease proteolytic subunit n=1 Tax=Candidatus Woesebacteria bacterium RIFCSPHIGHO2_01_FULL_41_10 TaxID=1802500 RepID=A0A1F7YM94_9BACT|nr:MAG: hypothetical protein A2801_02655 [Candidatus Woesebacteria bacterium RIFCSPHIGHO2_01_FULL_41_10]
MIIEDKDFRNYALRLVDDGYIPIFGEFKDTLQEVVIECIWKAKALGKDPVTLLINSNGGFNLAFSAIKAVMIESGLTFHGLVLGKAFSNGFNILQQCSVRKAVRDAAFMFHWGSQSLNNAELDALIAGEKWVVETIIEREMLTLVQVSERTGVPVKDLKKYAARERYFTAKQAKEIGFLDEIIPDLPKGVSDALSKKDS